VGRIAFLSIGGEERPGGYVRRLGRLRWTRRFPKRVPVELEGDRAATRAFAAGEDWIIVRDETALPIPGNEITPAAGHVVVACSRPPGSLPVVHTLAEFESASFPSGGGAANAAPPAALGFSVSDFPPAAGESVRDYVERLTSSAMPRVPARGFEALVFEDSSAERPEIVRRLPRGVRRLLDVGCGTGAVSAAVRRENPGVEITGIERQSSAADRARGRIDRVMAGDAIDSLRELAREGAHFDAFLFADVLEHLEDPIGALSLARGLALDGATLVASVPNVGHLSIVRDLVRGRFDPVPAGLADAGHLRWFTRSFLEDALDEAGWTTTLVEALPGAPAPDAEAFLERAGDFPEADARSLTTYQWVAVARAE
jgi:SAM-dependent methyltransferase